MYASIKLINWNLVEILDDDGCYSTYICIRSADGWASITLAVSRNDLARVIFDSEE